MQQRVPVKQDWTASTGLGKVTGEVKVAEWRETETRKKDRDEDYF